MSSVAILIELLSGHPPLAELVSSNSIVAGTVPNGMIPAIGVREISAIEHDTLARAGSRLVRARVQVTVYADTYPQLKELVKASGLGSGVYTGQVAGFAVRSVLREAIGPDLTGDEGEVFEQSRDFKVTYIEPV